MAQIHTYSHWEYRGQYPYIEYIKILLDRGVLGKSRFGPVKYVLNAGFTSEITDLESSCLMYWSPYINENIDFQIDYIEQTLFGLPDSFLVKHSTLIADNLKYGDLSYGEILKENYGINRFLCWNYSDK